MASTRRTFFPTLTSGESSFVALPGSASATTTLLLAWLGCGTDTATLCFDSLAGWPFGVWRSVNA